MDAIHIESAKNIINKYYLYNCILGARAQDVAANLWVLDKHRFRIVIHVGLMMYAFVSQR